jgi:hypothetical protein
MDSGDRRRSPPIQRRRDPGQQTRTWNTQQYERDFVLIRQTEDPTFPVVPVLMPSCDSPPTGFLQLLTWVDLSKTPHVLQQTEDLYALRSALRSEPIVSSPIRASICPYRGLEPFREEDAAFFCGRDKAILGPALERFAPSTSPPSHRRG